MRVGYGITYNNSSFVCARGNNSILCFYEKEDAVKKCARLQKAAVYGHYAVEPIYTRSARRKKKKSTINRIPGVFF